MGFMANDGGRAESVGADNPITELTADGLFSGTGGAVARGVIGGAAAVGRTAYDALSSLNKSTELTYDPSANMQQTLADPSTASPQMDEALKATQEWSKIDPRTAGVGAQTLGSLAHGATVFGLGTLAGGPVAGAATMGATEGYNDYRDSVAAGVDPTTAMEKATATGLFAAAGAALPFKFGAAGIKGLVASVAGGASVNTGFGVANRFLSSEILDANGYKDMAQQYRPLDQQSMLADAILGGVFGGFAHLTHGSDIPAAQRPTDDMVEQALDARRQDAVTRAGPGIPIDPEHSTLDGDLQDRALGNLLRGKPADITSDEASAMVEHTIADPERVQLHNDYQDANLEVHGQIADFSEPARVEEEPALSGVRDSLRTVADNLGLTVDETGKSGNRFSASGGKSITVPAEDGIVAGAQSADHVFAHEIGHAIHQKAGMSFDGFPAAEMKKWIPNWDEWVAASKEFRPDVHGHADARIRRYAKKPNEIIADTLGSVLMGHSPESLVLGHMNGLTRKDLGLEGAPIARAEPITKPEAPQGDASVPVTGGAAISPIHQEQLKQLAARNPDMDVEGPNGNTIKARDLPQALADHATQAASESKLHDVAMACFMRTM